MEMPTPCQKCGEIFDLHDGSPSQKWFRNTVVCEDCGRLEDDEMERDEEIEDIKNQLSDAEFTINECNKRLKDFNIPVKERTITIVDIATQIW